MNKNKWQIPNWFNINKYDFINELNDEELLGEIDEREFYYNEFKKGNKIKHFFKLITSEIPQYNKYHTTVEILEIQKNRNKYVLSSSCNIAPYSVYQLAIDFDELKLNKVLSGEAAHIDNARVYKDIGWTEEGFSHKGDEKAFERCHQLNGDLTEVQMHIETPGIKKRDLSGRFHCSMDLKNNSNQTILEELETLLTRWRKELDYGPEPKHGLITPAKLKKLKTYKIIPLMDLLIWAEHEHILLPKRILAEVLFPNGDGLDEEGMKNKAFPLLKQVVDGDFRNRSKS